MSWFARRTQRRRTIDPMLDLRLQRVAEATLPPIRRHHRMIRYVAVDVETTGPDLNKDRVISIGAAALKRGAIDFSDCFEVILRQSEASPTANVLIHRIGGDRQLSGIDPAEALVRFLEFVEFCPLVAFRSDFDRTMIERELRTTLGVGLQNLWIDLAKLMPALFSSLELRTMDEWLAHFGITLAARHDAVADAMATAQMLQVCLAAADRLKMDCPAKLDEMQRAQHWLGKR